MSYTIRKEKPPVGVLYADRWADFPPSTKAASYCFADDGGRNHQFVLRGKRRQVLEALMRGPVCAASRCRISNKIDALKHEKGIEIETIGFKPEGFDDHFGVYFLRSIVSRVKGDE
jgi:hypothetical protein